RIAAVPDPVEQISHLEPPGEGEWVEFADDRRTLLVYGGAIADPVGRLDAQGWAEFDLISTERALPEVPELAAVAAAVQVLPVGRVPEAAAAVVDVVASDRLVAVGGGRGVDAAEGVAAGGGGAVAAVPATPAGGPRARAPR